MARTIKYLDGKLNTFQSVEERNIDLLKEKEIREKGLLEAASFFKGSSTSPLASEEAAYRGATLGDKKGAFKDLYNVVDEAITIEEAVKDLEGTKMAGLKGDASSLKDTLGIKLLSVKKELLSKTPPKPLDR
jgi:hypothetical protein